MLLRVMKSLCFCVYVIVYVIVSYFYYVITRFYVIVFKLFMRVIKSYLCYLVIYIESYLCFCHAKVKTSIVTYSSSFLTMT